MPTPTNLSLLASECERRAAAGEKPALEWHDVSFLPFLGRDDAFRVIWISPNKYALEWWRDDETNNYVERSPSMSSFIAAQLFAESLLLLAVRPLVECELRDLRERCAEACDVYVRDIWPNDPYGDQDTNRGREFGGEDCAKAIRALSLHAPTANANSEPARAEGGEA